LKIRLPYFLPRGVSTFSINGDLMSNGKSMTRKNKRSIENEGERDRKRQRYSEEPTSTDQLAQPTAVKQSRNTADTFNVPHGPTFQVTRDSPRTDTAPALTRDLEQIPAENADHSSSPACQSFGITIPSKRSYPFSKDASRKRRKKESYVIVRTYQHRKDLEHTDEIECALTPDGGLDLVGLSQRLNVKGCQASRCNAVPICCLGHAYLYH
jgi:hypothetical protein